MKVMWRVLVGAGAICVGSAVAAQEPLAQSLSVLSAFDCTDGETRTIYVFQSDPEGGVTLLTKQEAPAAIGNDGFVPASRGAAERTFVFRDGSTAKGICASVTDAARATYPAITAGLLPEMGADTSAEMAVTLLTIRDLEGRAFAAEAAQAEMAAELAAAQANMASLQDALDQKDTTLTAQTEALQTMRQELAATMAQLDMTEQDRRKLVANVATLNQSNSALHQAVEDANETAEEATAEADAMANLADAAITWISTLQVRSAVAVRAEMCGTISGDARPSVCP